jgi:hypothetical protein
MGINLYLQTLDGMNHPEWDSLRCAGDRELVDLVDDLPNIRSRYYEEVYTRPTDFAAWRAAVDKLPNPARHKKLLDLLAADENYWLYVSW